MTLGKHGADARSEKYSFLDEISQEQLWNYTPGELKEILAQRDHVLDVITNERLRDQDFNNQYGFKYPDDDRPWMPDPKYECQHKVCHRCHSIGRQKSWVSLDGVLNGDIPPTVATGYSFSQVKMRPCVDVETVKNLGCRPVPLVSPFSFYPIYPEIPLTYSHEPAPWPQSPCPCRFFFFFGLTQRDH